MSNYFKMTEFKASFDFVDGVDLAKQLMEVRIKFELKDNIPIGFSDKNQEE